MVPSTTATASSVLTDTFAVDVTTSSGSVKSVTTTSSVATLMTTSLAVTSFSVPTPTPTPFTVVGRARQSPGSVFRFRELTTFTRSPQARSLLWHLFSSVFKSRVLPHTYNV
ncbi:hypothetical protein FRC08_001585 [Ceratobasidium sp. 394]|nr:hypothetical protein FRC08_001585 [Ceratobasidium sp. 394]